MTESPDLRWYEEASERRKTSRRCPYATVEACPRFYQRLSLLRNAGSTRIEGEEDERLLKLWRSSDLWPRTAEQATAVSGPDGNASSFSKFCPEVAYERFGFFATYLSRYSDEIDQDFAHRNLSAEGAQSGHALWSWQAAEPQHFSDCPVHAVLASRPPARISARPNEPPWWRKHLLELSVAAVVAIISIVAKLFVA